MKYIKKPDSGEYPPYAEMYMQLLPDDGRLLQHLDSNSRITKALMESISPEKLHYRYAPGKWSIPEILVHITDDERIYTYRAMCIARNDKTPLPGFDQDAYTRYSGAGQRALSNIINEYEAVRSATIALFNGLTEEALARKGNANGTNVSVRALAFHIAGHELHHINIIKKLYLK